MAVSAEPEAAAMLSRPTDERETMVCVVIGVDDSTIGGRHRLRICKSRAKEGRIGPKTVRPINKLEQSPAPSAHCENQEVQEHERFPTDSHVSAECH